MGDPLRVRRLRKGDLERIGTNERGENIVRRKKPKSISNKRKGSGKQKPFLPT